MKLKRQFSGGAILLRSWYSTFSSEERIMLNYGALPILLYHRVAIPEGTFRHNGYTVTPKNFSKQMKYLYDHGYHPITLGDWLDYCDHVRILPPKPVIITFDDGYKDNYTYAYPILREYQFTATIFLVVERIGDFNQWDKDFTQVPLLTWNEINEMSCQGIIFGTHTLSHQRLTKINPIMAQKEICASREILEDRLIKPVEFIAYPNGDYNLEIKNLVRKSGYRGAVTTQRGMNRATEDHYAMKRIYIFRDDTFLDFVSKIDGVF
jgi:peptidoglycan/xylan/chitin deacetylase (PgdA/CDA1 family)